MRIGRPRFVAIRLLSSIGASSDCSHPSRFWEGMLPARCTGVSRRYCVCSRRQAWRGRHALGLRSAAASSEFKEYRLCNGLDICTPSPKDVAFIEKEVFVDATYIRKGLELAEGGVVIDCGANVGIFSVFAAQTVGRSGVVLALEPVPETYSCLEENSGRLRKWEDGAEAGRIVCTRAAVGDGSKESMVMTVYPIVSGWSTLYPDDQDLGRDMRVFLDAALDEQDARSAGIRSRFLAPLARTTKNFFLTRPLYRLGRALYIRWMMSGKRQVKCDVVTISELLDRHALDKVDLLKIDVERAELDVLRGVQDRHWPCIRQVALECHEANVQAVRDLLEAQGFGSIETEQDEHLQGSSLHMLYARRQ